MRSSRPRTRAAVSVLALICGLGASACGLVADLGSYESADAAADAASDAGHEAGDAADAPLPDGHGAETQPCTAGCASDQVCGNMGFCVPNCTVHPCQPGQVCCPPQAMCASQCVPDCRVDPSTCTNMGHACDTNLGICAK